MRIARYDIAPGRLSSRDELRSLHTVRIIWLSDSSSAECLSLMSMNTYMRHKLEDIPTFLTPKNQPFQASLRVIFDYDKGIIDIAITRCSCFLGIRASGIIRCIIARLSLDLSRYIITMNMYQKKKEYLHMWGNSRILE